MSEVAIRKIADDLAEAVRLFRNTPSLKKYVKLRGTPQYAHLCEAWEEYKYATDPNFRSSWRVHE